MTETVATVVFVVLALVFLSMFAVIMGVQNFAINEQAAAAASPQNPSALLTASGVIPNVYYPGVPGLEANGGHITLYSSTPYTYQYQVPNNYLQTYTYQLPNNQLIQYSYQVPNNYLQPYSYNYYQTTQKQVQWVRYTNSWINENIPNTEYNTYYNNPTQSYQLFTYNGWLVTWNVQEQDITYIQGQNTVITGVTWYQCNYFKGVPQCPPAQPVNYVANIQNFYIFPQETIWYQSFNYCLQKPAVESTTLYPETTSTYQNTYITSSPEQYTYQEPMQGSYTSSYITYTSTPIQYTYTVYQSNPQNYQYTTYYSNPYTYTWNTPQNTQANGIYYVNVTVIQNGRYEVVQVPVSYSYYQTAFQSNSATAYQVYQQTNSVTQYGPPISQTYSTYYYSSPQPVTNYQTVYYIYWQQKQFSGYTQPYPVWYTDYETSPGPETFYYTQIVTDYSTQCPQPAYYYDYPSILTSSYETLTSNPPGKYYYPVYTYGTIYYPIEDITFLTLQDSSALSVGNYEPVIQYQTVTLPQTGFFSGGYYETIAFTDVKTLYESTPATGYGSYWATSWNTVSDPYWVTNGYTTQTGSYWATSFQTQSATAYSTSQVYQKYTYWNATITNTGTSPIAVVSVVYQGPDGTYTVPLNSQPSWSIGSWLVNDGWQPPPSWSGWQSWSSTGTPLSSGYYGYQWGGSGGSGFPFATTGSFTSYGVVLLPKQVLAVPFAPRFEVGFVLSDGSVFWIS